MSRTLDMGGFTDVGVPTLRRLLTQRGDISTYNAAGLPVRVPAGNNLTVLACNSALEGGLSFSTLGSLTGVSWNQPNLIVPAASAFGTLINSPTVADKSNRLQANWSGNASAPINRLMVKPIPAIMHTA